MSRTLATSAVRTQRGAHDHAQDARDARGSLERDGYGPILTAADLARILRVGIRRIYQMDWEGSLVFAELKPRVGIKKWSRDRVQSWIDGDLKGLTGGRHA